MTYYKDLTIVVPEGMEPITGDNIPVKVLELGWDGLIPEFLTYTQYLNIKQPIVTTMLNHRLILQV